MKKNLLFYKEDRRYKIARITIMSNYFSAYEQMYVILLILPICLRFCRYPGQKRNQLWNVIYLLICTQVINEMIILAIAFWLLSFLEIKRKKSYKCLKFLSWKLCEKFLTFDSWKL